MGDCFPAVATAQTRAGTSKETTLLTGPAARMVAPAPFTAVGVRMRSTRPLKHLISDTPILFLIEGFLRARDIPAPGVSAHPPPPSRWLVWAPRGGGGLLRSRPAPRLPGEVGPGTDDVFGLWAKFGGGERINNTPIIPNIGGANK